MLICKPLPPPGEIPSASKLREALQAHLASKQPHPVISEMAAVNQSTAEQSVESQVGKGVC